ncbi:2-phospho-L-lactate transferase [soil metagenome]
MSAFVIFRKSVAQDLRHKRIDRPTLGGGTLLQPPAQVVAETRDQLSHTRVIAAACKSAITTGAVRRRESSPASGGTVHSDIVRITALAGGVGGAKLLIGIDRALEAAEPDTPWEGAGSLTAIVNTGDDTEIYGLHVAPDIDIVTYWLAGLADYERGWGVAGDTFHALEAFAALGVETWFSLGDRDLAVCLYRSERMRGGASLSTVTDDIRRSLGLRAHILPMSDDPVRTIITTADQRTLGFQEYFVRERQAPEVAAVDLAGIEEAKPAPGVLDAIASADTVVICPSNPIVSIGPILALPEVREALRAHPKVVAVSPIVAGAALKGPAARMLASMGMTSSALTVARLYADFADKLVVDRRDEALLPQITALGLEVIALDSIMTNGASSESLARRVLGMRSTPDKNGGSDRPGDRGSW